MKKYLIALVALLVVVTGCGNTKKLTCTMTEDGENAKAVMEFDKEDKLTKMTMTMSQDFEQELTKEEVELYQGVMSAACASYPDEYADCEVKVDKKKMEIIVSYDVSKMTDEQIEEMGIDKTTMSYDEMKKDAEADGFTCK